MTERRAATNRAWYLKNRAKKLEQSRVYATAHRKEKAKQARDRRKRNPEKAAEYIRKYMRAYRAKNPESIVKTQERFYTRHPDYQVLWEKTHRPERLAKRKKWYEDNPGRNAFYTASRRALEKLAMPPWADRKEISAIYAETDRKTLLTGIPHETDHIWAIKGKDFVGLHVPWNLRTITEAANRKKGNRRPTSVEIGGIK